MAGDGAQPFNGKLDEIALLKTALNDQEISNYAISDLSIQMQKKLVIGNSTQVKVLLSMTTPETKTMALFTVQHGVRMFLIQE